MGIFGVIGKMAGSKIVEKVEDARSTIAPAILSATLSGWAGFTFSNIIIHFLSLHEVIFPSRHPGELHRCIRQYSSHGRL